MLAHLTCVHRPEVTTVKTSGAIGARHPHRTCCDNILSERPMGKRPPASVGCEGRSILQQPAIHCHSRCRQVHGVTRTGRNWFRQWLSAILAVSTASVSALDR
jgi:hypothetical protein